MATEASKFKIGLFVTLGAAIALSAVLALGAVRFFQDTATYVTYFEESVQGLEPDSLVRYRGVPIGRVHRIRIAPDGKLVEVVLKIDAAVKIEPDMRIRMRMAGITGMKYLEIDRRKDIDKPDVTPAVEFRPSATVIPSNPSDVQEILSAFERVFAQIQQLDVKGISDRLNASLDTLNNLIGRKEWEQTLRNIEKATNSLRDVSARIQGMLDKPGVEDSLAHAADTLKALSEISSRLNAELASLDLAEQVRRSSAKFDQFMEEGAGTARDIRLLALQEEDSLSSLVENLRRTTEVLNNLILSLRDNPSQILFAEPPQSTRKE